jgi:hypothetical protein
MRWPIQLRRLSYLLIAASFLGLGVAVIEGARAAYIKTSGEVSPLPAGRELTEEEWEAQRLRAREVKWERYGYARRHANIGLCLGLASAVAGITLGIVAEKANPA